MSDKPGPRLGPSFWAFWGANTLANLGDGMRKAALPLLAAALTRDARLVAGLTAAIYLPSLLVGLPAGAIADRMDRRKLMIWTNGGRAAVLGLLAGALVVDAASIWLLYLVALIFGVAEALHDNAARALLPTVVDHTNLERANGRLVAAEVVTNEFVGPLVGGALFAMALAAPFALNAGLSALAAALLALVAVSFGSRPGAGERQPLWADVREGLRWLAGHRLLRTLIGVAAVHDFVTAAWEAVLVLLALERLGVTTAGFGLLLAASAAGGLLGGLAAARVGARMGVVRTLSASLLLAGAAQLALGLAGGPLVAGLALASVSAVYATWNVLSVALQQRLVPGELLGRVNGVLRTMSLGAATLGALTGGLLATGAGVRAPFIAGALVPAILALVVARVASVELGTTSEGSTLG
jgi:MFS family permease